MHSTFAVTETNKIVEDAPQTEERWPRSMSSKPSTWCSGTRFARRLYSDVLRTYTWYIGDSGSKDVATAIREDARDEGIEEEDDPLSPPIHFTAVEERQFCRESVMKIGRRTGKSVRVDQATSTAARLDYARVCVEFDLTRPLLSQFKINKIKYFIQYDGFEKFCLKCDTATPTLNDHAALVRCQRKRNRRVLTGNG
ncbi:unnamed protein product [Linum trigynum]|uniref:Uncharacterized protein n=1 Tax=Linum trigynum TaxID=586398 RepID=A0AAV2CKT4_9ROSI